MLTRREFGKVTGTGALALGVGEISMGLSCATVFNDIANYVPVGLQAFQQIVNLVNPVAGSALAPFIADVKLAFADLEVAVTNYQNAPAASKSTLVGKITTAINDAIAQVQAFWVAANLPAGGIASTIEGVLQIILSTLAAFFPSIGGKLMAAKEPGFGEKGTGVRLIQFTPVKRSPAQLKKDINAAFVNGGHPENQIY
jgi:hypothetical protein